MDPIFGSEKMDRKRLMVNQRRNVKQHFQFNSNIGMKSKADPSVVSWASRGKGVQGESTNSTNPAGRLIVNRNWKPLQS